MSTQGHPEALRERLGDDGGWRYVDHDNVVLHGLLMLRGCDLFAIDVFIERLEAEGAPAGAELRIRRQHALRLFREEALAGQRPDLVLTDLAFAGHVEWIMRRKAEIERAERISIPARAKKTRTAETNRNNRTGKGKAAGITVKRILELKEEFTWGRGHARGWKKYAAGKLNISVKALGSMLPDDEKRKIRKLRP